MAGQQEFVTILCVQWCFASDSNRLLQLQPSLLDSGILAVDLSRIKV